MNPKAIITGASSGIGAEFARQLAAQQHDLILVARRREKLDALANQLNVRYGVQVSVYQADLSDPDQVAQLANHIADVSPLRMLVNNAGFGTKGTIWEADHGKQLAMIQLQVTTVYQLCRAAMANMVAAKRGGNIINVGSIAAYFRGSGAANYAGTKSYIHAFSEALQLEAEPHDIKIQALAPGYTYSEFHDSKEYQNFSREQVPKRLWDSAENVVKLSLAELNDPKAKVVFIPGRNNRLIVASRQSAIGRVVNGVARRVMRR